MLFKPASLLALAFALSSVAALRADLAPTAPAGDIEKRGLLNIDNVLCGIGLLGACVSTQTDVRNCKSGSKRALVLVRRHWDSGGREDLKGGGANQ